MSASAHRLEPASPPWPDLAGEPLAASAAEVAARQGASEVEFLDVVDVDNWRRILAGEGAAGDLVRAREEGYALGVDQGRAELRGQHEREVHAARDLLVRAAEEMRSNRQRMLHQLEEEMVRLALAVAARVVRNVAAVDDELVVATVKEAVKRAEGEGSLIIRVASEDLETVRRVREEIREALDGLEKIEFLADRRVGRGGCVVETSSSRIDARLDAQVSELSQAVLDHLEEGHAGPRLDGDTPRRT